MLKFRDRPQFNYDDQEGDNKQKNENKPLVRDTEKTKALDDSIIKAFTKDQKAVLRDINLDDATRIANKIYERYGTALHECVSALEDKGYVCDIKFIYNGRRGNPSFMITAKNYDKDQNGQYGIPNYNYLVNEDGRLERGESLDGRGGDYRNKMIMTAQRAGNEFSFQTSHNEVENFSSPVRIIMSPGRDGVKPFEMRVQYSPEAFAEGYQRMEGCLKGRPNYCHIYHELLTSVLRKDIAAASPDFIGEKALPEIDSKKSRAIHDRVFVSANIGPRNELFGYALHPNSDKSPYPVINRLRRKSQE